MSTAVAEPFFSLSRRLQQGIVNRLGWRQLRPVQNVALLPLRRGDNALILAPTAGGKTEAAMLPLLDRLVARSGSGVAILYLSPLRALLNNQQPRLELLASLVGAGAFKWHGEVSPGERKAFLAQPTQVLSLTPESLEVLLCSETIDKKKLFGDLQAVVVDEIHAFAGDDRGDHLIALLARLQQLLGLDFQRVGLSATVGNPQALFRWLTFGSGRPGAVLDPGKEKTRRLIEIRPLTPETDPGFVGGLLARGKKSLFFTDSRGRAEKVQRALRDSGVEALSHHSSLSRELREQSEERFRHGSNCCIVCTSTLELGLDVGDLDLVMQLDAPASVSAFLQRLGRTGRRAGSRGQMTFFTDTEWTFLRACALVKLALEGYVEPVQPSSRSYPVLVQQILARVLGCDGLTESSLWSSLGDAYCFSDISASERGQMVEHLVATGILARLDGRLVFGEQGEKRFARSNFLDLYCVFDSAQQLSVQTADQRSIGRVDAWFLQSLGGTGCAFQLGGRAWKVKRIDFSRGQVTVEPSIGGAAPSWTGPPRPLGRKLCQTIAQLLWGDDELVFLGDDAAACLAALRQSWGPRPLVEKAKFYTFAGGQVNNLLARFLELHTGQRVSSNNYWLTSPAGFEPLLQADEKSLTEVAQSLPAGRLSKFQDLLPEHLLNEFLLERLCDVSGCLGVIEQLRSAKWP